MLGTLLYFFYSASYFFIGGNEEPSYPIHKLYSTAESAISAASKKLQLFLLNVDFVYLNHFFI